MKKYRVTAMLKENQVIDEVEATSEEHAWVVASNKHLPERPLYNGKIEELPTREELTAELARYQAVAQAARELRVYINNPSAWEHYDDKMSERLRVLVDLAAVK